MPWTKANESYRKEMKVPDKLTQKTVELSRDVMPCSRARKVTWFGQVMNKRNPETCLSVKRNYKTVNTAKKSGWFVDLSKRLVQFSLHNFCCKFPPARKIYTGRTELPTCGKWLLLWRLLWKLTSCLGDTSLFSIGILFKAFLIWCHRFNFAHLCTINTWVALWRLL